MSAETNTHLFVAQLPRSATVNQLQALFGEVGTVVSLVRPRDKETGEFRSFAFVSMATPEEAAAVIERFNGFQLDDAMLVVKYNDKPAPAFAQKAVERTANRSVDGSGESKPKSSPPPPKPVEMDWNARAKWVNTALNEPGTASTLKMTLIGRPAHIETVGNLVILSMEHTLRAAGLPKGVPLPPPMTTRCIAYVSLKHWRKVAEYLQDPEDALILEGIAFFDEETAALSLLATNAFTKMMMAAKARPQEENPD